MFNHFGWTGWTQGKSTVNCLMPIGLIHKWRHQQNSKKDNFIHISKIYYNFRIHFGSDHTLIVLDGDDVSQYEIVVQVELNSTLLKVNKIFNWILFSCTCTLKYFMFVLKKIYLTSIYFNRKHIIIFCVVRLIYFTKILDLMGWMNSG